MEVQLLFKNNSKLHLYFYFINVSFFFLLLCSLFFLKTTISILTYGLSRLNNERTELKPILSRIIDSLYVKESDTVQQGNIIAKIKDNSIALRFILNEFELTQRLGFISDLEKLTTTNNYQNEQYGKFLSGRFLWLTKILALHFRSRNAYWSLRCSC
jgi:hypothetical protein